LIGIDIAALHAEARRRLGNEGCRRRFDSRQENSKNALHYATTQFYQQASRVAMSCDLGLTARAIIGGAAGKFRGGDLAAAPGAASTLLPVWD
jgi:hypothetical protein